MYAFSIWFIASKIRKTMEFQEYEKLAAGSLSWMKISKAFHNLKHRRSPYSSEEVSKATYNSRNMRPASRAPTVLPLIRIIKSDNRAEHLCSAVERWLCDQDTRYAAV